MKIMFDLYYDETPFFIKIGKYLKKKHDIDYCGISLANRWNRELEKDNVENYNIESFLFKNWNKIDISYENINKIEKKYDIPNLSWFIQSDRVFCKKNYENSLKYLVGHFLFFEKIFKEAKPDFFIGPGIAFLSHLVSFHVAKKVGVKFFCIYTIRSKEYRFVCVDNYQDVYQKVEAEYNKICNRELTENENQFSEDIIKEYNDRSVKPAYMTFSRQSLNIRSEFVKEFLIRLRRYFIENWRKSSFDYITRTPFYYMFRYLKKFSRVRFYNLFNLFDSYDVEKNFFFFPLHLQPESSTLILGKYYVDQINVIKNLSKSIPAGSLLYVKEHISAYGTRPLSYYNEIKKINNVKLISPYENSIKFIQKSTANIVISSTVGWESILLGKKTIALGNAFYNKEEFLIKVNCIQEIPAVIKDKLPNFKVDREKLKKFLLALYKGSYPGLFDVPHCHADNKVMKNENVKKIAEGIYKEILDNNEF